MRPVRARGLRVHAALGLAGPAILGLAGPAAAQLPAGAASPAGYPVDPLGMPRPSIQATRVDLPLAIDGRLDEAGWSRAVVNRDTWIQTVPDPGMPASQETVLRILYDDTNLYIGAVLFDEDPHDLAVPGLEQDSPSEVARFGGRPVGGCTTRGAGVPRRKPFG